MFIRYLYLAHILVDFLLPIKILNKKQQANALLICEIGSGVAEVLKYLEGLQEGDAREFEELFWKQFDDKEMVYRAGARTINLQWVAGALLRVRTHKSVQENLKSDREVILNAFIQDFKTFYPKDPWQVFDILALKEGNMGSYGVQEIAELYSTYSVESKVLCVKDDGKGHQN
jgi:hypothetical protein